LALACSHDISSVRKEAAFGLMGFLDLDGEPIVTPVFIELMWTSAGLPGCMPLVRGAPDRTASTGGPRRAFVYPLDETSQIRIRWLLLPSDFKADGFSPFDG
jgi:hypothetical protein